MVLLVYWRTSLTANLLLNVPEGGKISRQAPRGSFATLPTHFKWITGFDAGSQAFSLTCAGCCGQDWQVFRVLEQQAIIAALYQHYFFYHYSAILIHILFLSTSGLWRQSPTRSLEKGRILHLNVCNLAFISNLKTGYCMAMRLFVTMVTDLARGGSNLIINEEINLTWPAGKQICSGSALVALLQAPAYKDMYR